MTTGTETLEPGTGPAAMPDVTGPPPGKHRWWGYGVWLFTATVIGSSEIWAAAGNPWWPTISATVGHLEQLWNPTKIIVVAMLACVAVQVLRYPPRRREFPVAGRHRPRWRTSGGRLTRKKPGPAEQGAFAWLYFPGAVAATAAAGASAALLGGSKLVVGYAIYGVMAAAFVVIPNALAFWRAKDVPFPTLFTTLDELDQRYHLIAMVIVAGLVVLAIHLVAYPWP